MHQIYKRIFLFFAAMMMLPGVVSAQSKNAFETAREKMVKEDVEKAGVKNPRVLEAMRATPRHEFVPFNQIPHAYLDMALPIGEGQTISPPYIVASMTEALDPQPTDVVLEIGTGSGYQAAVLSSLVKAVYTIEIVEPLGRKAAKTLEKLHYENVHVKVGDGYLGWPEHGPFDKIIVTCSPEKAPPALVEQLKEGGRMVIPVGERYQQTMYLMKKVNGQMEMEALRPTLFVPMTGQAEAQREVLPDPTKPTLINGSFEEGEGDPPEASYWHYQRQVEWKEGDEAPQGTHYLVFKNDTPGLTSQILQGLGLDGRKVRALDISLSVRGKKLRQGQNAQQVPAFCIVFYDENRGTIGDAVIGPWRDTFEWKKVTQQIEVPTKAREAIVWIGLLGGTGELSVDNLQMKPAKPIGGKK